MSINYNEPISFGRCGSALALKCNGIDFSENLGGSWTHAPTAELEIQLPIARNDVVLELEASPFLVPRILSVQNIFLFLGGLFVGYHALRGRAVRSFAVNRGLIGGRVSCLTLVIPTATSPHALGVSDDLRDLGIYLISMTFKTIP